MDASTISLALVSLFGWGVGSFVAKIATNSIGEKAVFWDLLGYFPLVMIYCLAVYKVRDVINLDRGGIMMALLAGAVGSIGVIAFYILLTKKDASMAVPITALYPALTAILAIIFLNESLTLVKGLGIVLSVVALVLLSL